MMTHRSNYNDDHPGSLASHHYARQTAGTASMNTPPKILPVPPMTRRATTSTTWAFSSSSSSSLHSTQSPSGSPCRSPRRRLLRPGDTTRKCAADNVATDGRVDDFGSLARLSLQYRDRCLLLDQGHPYHQATGGMLERFLISLEALQVPITAQQGNAMTMPCFTKKLPEPVNDADRKPAAKKTLFTPKDHLSCSNQKASPLPVPVPPRRQLKGDPLSDASDLQLLADPEEVRQQQAILDAIAQERSLSQAEQCATTVPPSAAVSTSSRGSAAAAPRRRQQAPQPPRSPHQGSSRCRKSAASKGPSSSLSAMVDDQVASLGNGKKIRLKGTKHAYKSILRGQATIVQCPCCHIMLQISSTAKNLYCTACQQVSPIDTTASSSRMGQQHPGLDNEIARALQRQEVHVSQTAKQAKS